MLFIYRFFRLEMWIIVLSPGLNHSSEIANPEKFTDEDLGRSPAVLEMGFFANPHTGTVDLACHGSHCFDNLDIICPKLDDLGTEMVVLEKEKRSVPECQHVERKITWKYALLIKTFSCFCQARFSKIQSNIVHVDSSKLKKVQITHMTKDKNMNRTLRLKCGIYGFPPVHVDWFKDHRKLELEETTEANGVNYKLREDELIFNTTSRSASAFYSCQASNLAGKERGQQYNLSLHEFTPSRASLITQKCTQGFTEFGTNCIDVNECLSDPCIPNTTCFNTIGSFGCYGNDDVIAMPDQTNKTNQWAEQRTSPPTNQGLYYLIPGLSLLIFVNAVVILTAVKYRKKHRLDLPSLALVPVEDETTRTHICTSRLYPTDTIVEKGYGSVPYQSQFISLPVYMPKMANPRFFVRKEIDHNGGHISLHDTGIKLVILPGSLPQGRTEAIYLALMKNDPSSFPYIKENQALVSPLILCGPHGLQFLKPVMLLFPHCAIIGKRTSRFKVLCSETRDNEPMKWRYIVKEGESHNNEFFFSKNDNGCCLYASHFTGFGATNDDNKKEVSVLAFRQNHVANGGDFSIRVYFVPGFKSSKKDVYKQEQTLDGKLCDAERPLHFNNNSKGLDVSIQSISEGWECVLNEEKQEIEFPYIWESTLNSSAPSCTFTLKHTNTEIQNVRCNIVACQGSDGKPVKISVSAMVGQMGTANNQLRRTDSGFESSSERLVHRYIPAELKCRLMRKLDRSIRALGPNDWTSVAEKIGMVTDDILWLRDNTNIVSPTEYVLQFWENQPDDELLRGLDHLEHILFTIGRNDAVEIIQSYCNRPVESSRGKVTTV